MPKEWYDFNTNKILEEDTEDIIKRKEFNLRILANKKPYFFQYIYPHLRKEYNSFRTECNNKCITQFGITIEELFNKKDLTEDEIKFLEYYELKNPLTENNCTMNRICKRIEEEFKNIKDIDNADEIFNYDILKNNTQYSKNKYNKIFKLYNDYNYELSQFKTSTSQQRMTKEERHGYRDLLIKSFKEKCFEICSNENELCNILIDICYKSNRTKQFAWDICGKQIVGNLLVKNHFIVNYPELDSEGDIDFGGYTFTMKQKNVIKDYLKEVEKSSEN